MKRIPEAGVIGEAALREAATSELGAITSLVMNALNKTLRDAHGEPRWINVVAVYPDKAIVQKDARLYAYPYTLGDDNAVEIGTPVEVVMKHEPVSGAPATPPPAADDAAAGEPGADADADPMREAAAPPANGWFIEAKGTKSNAARYLVRVIRAGVSLNDVNYPTAVLREAAPLFNGVRVFAKSDVEHVKGGGKDFRLLVGRLVESRFVESKGGGEIQAVLEVLESADVAPKLREAVERGMTDLFGLSIDAEGGSRRSGKFREATSIKKVSSVDLIIEPGAGGQVIRFAEAVQESDMKLRKQMIDEIKKVDPSRAQSLESAGEDEVLQAYRESVGGHGGGTPAGQNGPAGATDDQVDEKIRMVEARAYARAEIRGAKLPEPTRTRLAEEFAARERFTEADVDAALKRERDYLGAVSDQGKVQIGQFVEAGEDRSEKVTQMFDDFFDQEKPPTSFREAYAEVTGDRMVTGLIQNCDRQRLAEAAGSFREAVSAATFADILGDSIARAMVREYNAAENYRDWRDLADVVPVRDFRTQERTRMGGYGNLPAVAENGPYTALATPGDESASYALSKRGGIETISLEAIANDDVGVIRRIPRKLGVAAARTLYEFVLDFLASNGVIYDGLALFVAGHNNLGTAALDAASFAASRLRMKKQTEADSAKPLGLLVRHLYVPADLEEAAYDLFVRDSNNDETFVQSRKPRVHVVDYWTDVNNWFTTADKSETPLIELGFYGGNEEPEIFVQDNPTQGSLFSNDQLKWKIRHTYSGAVIDYRGLDGNIVA